MPSDTYGAPVHLSNSCSKQKDKKKKCSPGEGAHHTIREAITMGAACFRSIHLFMIMTLWTVAAAGAVTVPAAIFLLR